MEFMQTYANNHVNGNPMQRQTLTCEVPFDSTQQRLDYEARQHLLGWICEFHYLSSDSRGRDLYQVTREKR